MVETSELKRFSFFEGFPESEVAALASIGAPTQWMEGETLFERGSPATNLYLLMSGVILLCFPEGRSLVVAERGHAIGWSSFVSPFRYTATAICLTDASLHSFPGREVARLIQMDADFGRRLMQRLAQIMEQRRPYRRLRRRVQPGAPPHLSDKE